MDDSELGSFFSEINEIVAAVDTVIEEPVVSAPVVVSKPPEVYYPQVISKPAEINKSVEAQERPDYPSSGTASTDYSRYQPGPASGLAIAPTLQYTQRVAPPQVPRQDKVFVRRAAEETWVDESLQEWPENDYRIFVGDLAKEVTTEHLTKHFQPYKSFARAKVIRTKHEAKARGYGFVSFLDPMDCAKAIREQNGKYLLSRPMKITKSSWKDKDLGEVQKKDKKKRKMQEALGLV